MNTSSRFVVALHILTIMVLSRLRGVEVLTSGNLAGGVNTNAVVVRRILGRLRIAGLVVSVPGPTGGSRLARDPDKVTLQNVYEALDEGELFHMHYSEPNQACPIGCNIQGVLAGPLDAAAQAMKESLSSKTLADIAGQMQRTCEQNEQAIESAV